MKFRTALSFLLFAALLAGCGDGDFGSGPGLSGTWLTDGGSRGLDVTQDGNALSGLLLWDEIYYPCHGTVSGNSVSLTATLTDRTASITATVSDNTLTARVEFDFHGTASNYAVDPLVMSRR